MGNQEAGETHAGGQLEELYAELQLREARYHYLSERARQVEESSHDTAERNAARRDANTAWFWVESGLAKYSRLAKRDVGDLWKILSEGRDYGVVIWDLPWRCWEPDRMDWSFLNFMRIGEGYRFRVPEPDYEYGTATDRLEAAARRYGKKLGHVFETNSYHGSHPTLGIWRVK